MTPAQFFSSVCAHSPAFADAQEAHLRANGAVLPHVLMSDLLRFVGMGVGGEQWLGVRPPSSGETRDLVALLELGLSLGDPDLLNALCVSFVEGLDGEPFFAGLLPMLGPHVLAELARQQQWRNAR